MGSLKRFNSLPSSALSSFHFSPPHSHYPPGHLFPRGPEPPTCRVPCLVETRRHETRRKRSIEETLTVDFSQLQTLLYLHPPLFSEASAVGSILFTTNIQTSRQVRSILVDPSSVRPGLNQTKSNSNHFVSTNQPWLFNLKHLQHPLFSCNFGHLASSSLTFRPIHTKSH